MKILAMAFLLFATAAHSEDTTETDAILMDIANFPGRTFAGICGYGMYHNPAGECVTMSQWVSESTKCEPIEINDVSYPTYKIDLDVSTFLWHEVSGNCRGLYSEYTYDPNLLTPIESSGDFLYTVTNYAGICGYGQYHLNGTCYEIGKLTEETRFGCDTNYHKTVATDASFMGPKEFVTNPKEPLCNGDYLLYNFVDGTDSESYDTARIYPMYNGTLLFVGAAETRNISTFDEMYNNRCSANPDNYYNISLLGSNTSQPFAFPILGMCDTGYSKFIVDKNCHYIKSDADVAENMICGVLCEKPEHVYTNSGVCSERGYCSSDGKHRRLHVGLPNGGGSYSYPLYASKTTTPSLNFQFVGANGATQTCYVNLVPPDAIKHFVTEKPNPLRLGYPRTWTMGDGKEYSTETLITID